MTKRSIKRTVMSVPRDQTEADDFLSRIAQEQRLIDNLKLKLETDVDRAKRQFMNDSEPHKEHIKQLFEGLYVFAEANRDELTNYGKRKTVKLLTGIFGWRKTPPAVKITKVSDVLASLKALGLKQFIRTKEEIDKEAMLKDQELAITIKGVSIVQKEEFMVKPTDLEEEIASDIKKLKK